MNGNTMNGNTFINTVILTAAVFAALISSVANIVISLMNNHRLKKIEKQKQMNEIDKYRYSRLYDLIINWHKYDSVINGETAEEIAFYRMLNLFIDDSGRYEMAKPLLDKRYIKALEIKKAEGEQLLGKLVDAEAPDGTHTKEFPKIKEQYFKAGSEFSKLLKSTINRQLECLLRKSY